MDKHDPAHEIEGRRVADEQERWLSDTPAPKTTLSDASTNEVIEMGFRVADAMDKLADAHLFDKQASLDASVLAMSDCRDPSTLEALEKARVKNDPYTNMSGEIFAIREILATLQIKLQK